VQDIFQETLYWKNKYPKIRQDSSSQIKAIYETSRLIVYTYIQGTGYVECLALNRPIIILAPNVGSAFKPEFRPFVKRMQKIGMIFDNAEAAAAHVNAVYCKIEDWWLSVEVQSVIRDFQEHYVKMDHSPKRFAKVLEKIAMENSKW
jgi:putative transferase (TIGR04331 family)